MNAPLSERIICKTDKDLSFAFDDNSPTFYLKPASVDYGSHERVDPFPCYAHDEELVEIWAAKTEAAFPVNVKPYWYILNRETLSRTNGYASQSYSRGENKRLIIPYIVLQGKRIPPLPAMTRYLVAHEYGHVVDAYIAKMRGGGDEDDNRGFRQEYAKMRGIEFDDGYGALKWHTNTGEIIANDFRIAVMGVERDFWPHPVSHPDEDKRVSDIWYQLMLEFGYE